MWRSGRRVLHDLLRQSSARTICLSPVQHTVIVERWWQVPLSKVGRPPRLYARRHNIYKLVEDTRHSPKEDMELILTQTVSHLGDRGDTVFVQKSYGRNKLLAKGLAVYPSPENKHMFAEEIKLFREGKAEGRIQTRTGKITVKFLQRSNLQIKKTLSDEFQLTKAVVCRQLDRKLGVVVPIHALTLPFEPIKELGDYWCDVTVNGLDTVRIPMSLLPYKDVAAEGQPEEVAKTSTDTQTNHDTTAPPSESPEKS